MVTLEQNNNMESLINHIVQWIKNYTNGNSKDALVVGISGGIDSSVVSTLCCMTGIKTIVVSLPLHQRPELHSLSLVHAEFLKEKFKNVQHINMDLSGVYDTFYNLFLDNNGLAQANTKSRLRMVTLYHIAQLNNGLVAGTGNKVEDFGVGFFTKWGDGGVDISPIGDCMKTEVWNMGKILGISQGIIDAPPTDGLWSDGRTDQQQLNGLTYPEIEAAMNKYEAGLTMDTDVDKFYLEVRNRNLHKMKPIPVCPNPRH